MNLWVHYRLSDGVIVGWENSPQHCIDIAGIGSVAIPVATDPDHKKQKIDLASLQIVDMTPQEMAAANAPTREEVRALVSTELSDSDLYFSVSDYPMSDAMKADWLDYRRQLRDLSKNYSTPSEMVLNWPPRPDGIDAAQSLRERL